MLTGGFLGLLAWVTIGTAVVALLRGTPGERWRLLAWAGLLLGILFTVANLYAHGHLDGVISDSGALESANGTVESVDSAPSAAEPMTTTTRSPTTTVASTTTTTWPDFGFDGSQWLYVEWVRSQAERLRPRSAWLDGRSDLQILYTGAATCTALAEGSGTNDAIDRGLLTYGDFGDATDEYLLPLYAVMGSAAMVQLCPELLPDEFG